MKTILTAAAVLLLAAGAARAQPPPVDPGNFTGKATVSQRISGTGGSRMTASTVTFEKGARTKWHTHPLGQMLVVTEGGGWLQIEGQPSRTLRPGDVAWTAPGVRHWHGGTRTSGMTHIAITESVEGAVVQWMEPVREEDYRGPSQ